MGHLIFPLLRLYNSNLQKEAVIHDALGLLEEGVPGENPNYESKRGEGEGERDDSDSREIHEHGSVIGQHD